MWQTPKTDWAIQPYVSGRYQGDWFNIEDYNRIVGNLRYLHAAGQNVYATVFSILGMSSARITAFPRASDIGALEDVLYALTQNTYSPPTYAGKRSWSDGGVTPDVTDLNRIEQACADLYAKYNETPRSEYHLADGSAYNTTDGALMVR